MACLSLSQLIQITIEWFKTPKPKSGIGMDGWMDGIRVVGGIEHLMVLKSFWFGCRFEQRKVFAGSCFDCRQQYKKIGGNYKLPLCILNLHTRDQSRIKCGVSSQRYICPFLWLIAQNSDFHDRIALFLRFVSGSLFVFTVYFLMQPHIRHPRRCIFTLVTFDRHFSAPHIWVLRLPA